MTRRAGVRLQRRLLPHDSELEQDPDSHITGFEDPEEYARASVARGDYKAICTWLKGMERWAQRASAIVEDQALVNDEQIEEAYSREQPRVVTSLELDKPDYLTMSICTGSSNLPFAFADADKGVLATRSDNRCSICSVKVFKGEKPKAEGEAAHYIGASESTARDVLKCATFYEIVSARGPLDAEDALGVNDALANGLWLCRSCHERLGAEVFVLCPPLKILRVIRDEWDLSLQTLQEFLKMKYKHFPRLRSMYHLLQVGRLVPPPVMMATGRVVNLGREQFCLHDIPDPNTNHSYHFDSNPTVPHLWRFPCLKPENVMAVLLQMTGNKSKNSLLKDPPASALTYDDRLRTLLFKIMGRIHQIKGAMLMNLSADEGDEDGDWPETSGTEIGGNGTEMEEDSDGGGDGE